jgi:hypothetical protein
MRAISVASGEFRMFSICKDQRMRSSVPNGFFLASATVNRSTPFSCQFDFTWFVGNRCLRLRPVFLIIFYHLLTFVGVKINFFCFTLNNEYSSFIGHNAATIFQCIYLGKLCSKI